MITNIQSNPVIYHKDTYLRKDFQEGHLFTFERLSKTDSPIIKIMPSCALFKHLSVTRGLFSTQLRSIDHDVSKFLSGSSLYFVIRLRKKSFPID